jgi:acyl-CoA synthetase (AMP-forming)/AMP-acid ligase II
MLRDWQGGPFDAEKLRYLEGDVATSFDRVCREHAARDFVHWIASDGHHEVWTYTRFAAEVHATRGWLATFELPRGVTICTLDGNTPRHLATIVAVMLSGYSLALVDPREVTYSLEKKLAAIPGLALVISDRADTPSSCRRAAFPSPGGRAAVSPPAPAAPVLLRVLTSGSTGYSKVVEWGEAPLLANVEAVIRHHRLFERKTVLTPLPVHHVNCLTFAFLATLLSGGTLVLMERFALDLFWDALVARPVQIVSVVPHILATLAQHVDTFASITPLPDYFVTAAAPLSHEFALRLVADFPVPVLQGYGLAEAVNFSCTMPLDLSLDERLSWLVDFPRPSIGVPLDFNSVHVVDEQGVEVHDEGVIGELAVRGWNVMNGYADDDNSDVFAGDFLRTGDLGCFTLDARGRPFFFITGRKKEIVKRYGEAVSLLEVDDLFSELSHEGHAAIAIAFANQYAGDEIAVLVATPGDTPCDFTPLIELAECRLPEMLRPRLYVQTNALVRTPTGKPDRLRFAPLFAERFGRRMFGRAPVRYPGRITREGRWLDP